MQTSNNRRSKKRQLQPYIESHFSYKQQIAYKELASRGWRVFAVRRGIPHHKYTILIRDPKNGAIKIFRKDGVIDHLTKVPVRGSNIEFQACS